MEIVDEFLDQEIFDELQTFLMNNQIPWHYKDSIDYPGEKNGFQFEHLFYNNIAPCSANFNIVIPTLNMIEPLSIIRIKANLLTKTPNIIENTLHCDMEILPEQKQKQWTTSILYINTNDGYTKFEDGTKVESVANRMVSFPAHLKHLGTSCTNEKTRVVINFNYFEQ